MVDTGDPLCEAASLFGMEDYLVIAMTEQALFEQLLDRLAPHYLRRTAAVAAMFPGRLWRICGPEYATEPYLPHELMRRYVQPYTGPMVRAIRQHGGFVRMHCHARVTKALPMFVEMGADAVDPLEPPPQGDADLAAVRREFGRDLTLFGNIEASDIETLDERAFERVVGRAIEAGTSGEGRGFVLMPSASPYGRTISPRTLANYRTMVRMVGAM
jgi:hypothetical protein